MLKYKNILVYLLIYFIITFVFGATINSIDITIDNLYYNIYLFIIILLIYFVSVDMFRQLPFQLHRYSNIMDFYKERLRQYTILNFVISICIFISNWIVAFLFGSLSYTYMSGVFYLIHMFFIFEIVFLILLCFVHKFKFTLISSILFFLIFIMYFICILNNYSSILPINIFTYFFSSDSTNQFFSIFYYILWIVGILLLLKFRKRDFEL